MSTLSALLADPAHAGVFQLNREPRDIARAAEEARLACFLVDISHAHGKGDFLKQMAKTLRFPDWFGNNWDSLADCLKDLSWLEDAASANGPPAGYVLVLEKSKHFAAAHREEFEEAMDLLGEVSDYWRAQNKPFWTLIGGPEGWNSGWPELPSA
jgi:hypothetical protein